MLNFLKHFGIFMVGAGYLAGGIYCMVLADRMFDLMPYIPALLLMTHAGPLLGYGLAGMYDVMSETVKACIFKKT